MMRNVRWWKKIAVAAMLVCLLLPAISGAVVMAESVAEEIQAASEVTEERAASLYFDDVVLRGGAARHDAFFEIGKGQRVAQGSYLDLSFSHSPSLLPHLSSLSILVDDIPLGGIALDRPNGESRNWRVDLSPLQLGPGYHKVSLLAQMKLSDELCEAPDNELLWLTVDGRSTAVLKLATLYDKADLSWYPSPFVERGGDQPLRAVMVVPDAVGQGEFSAAARLSQFFAAQTPTGQLPMPIYTESDVTDQLLANRHAIWIGTAGKWKKLGVKAMEAAERAAERSLDGQGQGAIVEIDSPWNEAGAHLVIAGSDEQMQRAAAILTTESLYRQLLGRVLNVPEQDVTPQSPERADMAKPGEVYSISLKQLGYDQLKIENVLHGGAQFQYRIPAELELGDEAWLRLNYTHSKSIVYDKSVLTVKINGTPVQSVGLAERTSDAGKLDVRIDPAVLGSNRQVNVDIEVQFANPVAQEKAGVTNTAYCKETLLGDWAVIGGDSELRFTPDEREQVYLQSLPFPYIREGRWQPTAVIVPATGTRELQLAMTLVGKLGTSMPDVSGLRLESLSAVGWEERVRNNHLIYIGAASDLPASLNGFADSYVRFADNAVSSQSAAVPLLEPLQKQFAVMQLTSSPYAANRHLLLLAAASPERLAAIGQALTDPKQAANISSRLAAIDSKGEVLAFPATEDRSVRKRADGETISERWSSVSVSGLVFAAVMLIVVCAIAFAVYWNYRKTKT